MLVVEDDPATAQLLRDRLGLLGYTVECAMDGNRGVTLATTREYCAVVLDLGLPEYDGVELLHILRKRHLVNPVKVIVVTGDTDGVRRDELKREGIHGYFTKPIDFDALSSELAQVTGEGVHA